MDTEQVKSEKRHDRMEALLRFIGYGLYEKEEAVRLALLASVAGESVFFLGPPGTAKSLVSRRLRCAFKDDGQSELSYFEYLMNEFSTPDEIFGPVSLKALEENKYERITEGYLPKANIAFLDEIWKAGPAIQNTLLTIINEKKFHNGNEVLNVPLKALISAGNELPAENRGLEALWDRFLIRATVNPIQDAEKFMDLLCGEKTKTEVKPDGEMAKNLISTAELEAWQGSNETGGEIESVEVPEDVQNVIAAIRQEMARRNEDGNRDEKEKFYVSDRRWKKIVNVLKTSAFLNDRAAVDLMDCQLIEHCIWNTEKQIDEAKEIVKNCIEQNGLEFDITDAIGDIEKQIEEFNKHVTEQFYETSKNTPRMYKMNDEKNAYKLAKAQTFYSYNRQISVMYLNENNYYDDQGKVFDDDYSPNPDTFKISGVKVQFDDYYRQRNYSYNNDYHHEFTIETYDKIVKSSKVFETADLLKLRQDKADSEQYNPILESIKGELQKIDSYVSEKSAPFEANLFADQKMREVILTTVEKSKVEFEKAGGASERFAPATLRKRYARWQRKTAVSKILSSGF